MAAKPLPRIRAGISGSPVLSPSKRAVSLSGKPKPQEFRNQTKHVISAHAEEPVLDNVKNISEFVHHVRHPGRSDSCSKQNSHQSFEKPANTQSLYEKMERGFDHIPSQMELDRLTVNANSLVNHSSVTSDAADEVVRLKKLMMLQISLISRQQDLLKLRDKEILHLKTTTQSYKSRLERMERRIILSRRHSDVTGSMVKSEVHSSICLAENDRLKSPQEVEVFNQNVEQHNCFNDAEKDSCIVPTPHKRKTSLTESQVDAKNRRLHDDDQAPPTAPLEFTSPTSMIEAAYAASGYVPVPMSFVDRCRNQLAPMASPDKVVSALNTSSIDGFDSPKSITLKVCEHCPHCTVMAAGVKTSISQTGHAVEVVNNETSTENAMAASQSAAASKSVVEAEYEPSSEEPEKILMEVDHAYHVHTNLRDQDLYRFTDLDHPIGEDCSLNIPTWRIHKFTPLTNLHQGKDPKEVVDDDAYSKRHGRLEISEKRRKRWDIQRIREYRYNEKLRQKLSKQCADDDFETFAPSLSSVSAIEVKDALPINVFGHSLMSLKREEFSLPSGD